MKDFCVDFDFDNDENVASRLKNTYIKAREQKLYPIYKKWPKLAKIDTRFMTKTAEKPYPLEPHIPI